MNLVEQVNQLGLVKMSIDQGGSIHPLIIPADMTNGTGLMNPSVYIDGDRVMVNIRHVNYTLYHSENRKFQHRFGPLQYLNPENDITLRTWNYLCELNSDLTIKTINKVDTTWYDVEPLWEFIGLEDGRLVRWHDKLYLCGVRRDTTINGQGRMELSEIRNHKEIARTRMPAPGLDNSYCEKNWMPILDQPYHWVKWANPTEIICYDVHTKEITTALLDRSNFIPDLPEQRGSSHVIPWGNYYIAITHEVNLFKPTVGLKDAAYLHRFVVWDRNWRLIKITDSFSFMNADIEFCCGLAVHKDNFLISFGYQDNCAFILKVPTSVIDQYLGLDYATLDWGKINQHKWFRNVVETEVFKDNVYQKFFPVSPEDVVVDIGASVGPFAWQAAQQNAAKIICLEPEPDLFQTLLKNTKDLPVVAINKAMAMTNGIHPVTGVFDPAVLEINDTKTQLLDTIDFATLLKQQNLKKIDFLKLDCEGGEYAVFTESNHDWIQNNVGKIAMEIHLHSADQKNKFRHFRDIYLKNHSNYQVLSTDYVDIKSNLFTDWFINYYSAVMIYIDNRQKPELWQQYPAATLEITTIVPEKGCVVDCVFCPQRTLEQKYQGERILTVDKFKQLIASVPQAVRITFSGFVEPWMNKNCTDMLLYAHQEGHPISVFTTGVGMSIDDCERIVDIPYAGNPNGGFVLHLPDAEGLAKHPMTPGYRKTLTWFEKNQHRIKNFTTMSMGPVHADVVGFNNVNFYQMYDRAGNLSREAIIKPELNQFKDRVIKIHHKDNRTCGCVEHLYHNVLLPNGDVSLCCMDYALDHIIGNLYTQQYRDVIPKPNACFSMCSGCENGVKPIAN